MGLIVSDAASAKKMAAAGLKGHSEPIRCWVAAPHAVGD
jgi:hypothetical protein